MSVRFDRSEAPGTIRLEGDIDVGCAAELKALLEEAMAPRDGRQRGARIAVATATGMDVTAVQLLWAAEREAQAAGMVLALEGPVPEMLRTALREAGFQRFPLAPHAQDDADDGAQRGSQG